jgi:hypothetical protein
MAISSSDGRTRGEFLVKRWFAASLRRCCTVKEAVHAMRIVITWAEGHTIDVSEFCAEGDDRSVHTSITTARLDTPAARGIIGHV